GVSEASRSAKNHQLERERDRRKREEKHDDGEPREQAAARVERDARLEHGGVPEPSTVDEQGRAPPHPPSPPEQAERNQGDREQAGGALLRGRVPQGVE